MDDDVIMVDTSINAVILVLPNIRGGAIFENPKCFKINDSTGNAGTNNITVEGCGGDSVNSTASFVMSNNYESAETNPINLDEWFISSSAGNTPVTGFVPYVGATANVNLGAFNISATRFIASGNVSSAAWTTSGLIFKETASTHTDTSSSGTVSAAYTNLFGGSTIAATNSTTYTNYYGTYFELPVAGSNVTMSSRWAAGFGGNTQTNGIGYFTSGGVTGVIAPNISSALLIGTTSNHNVNFFTNNGAVLMTIYTNAGIKINPTVAVIPTAQFSVSTGGLTNLFEFKTTTDTVNLWTVSQKGNVEYTPAVSTSGSITGFSYTNASNTGQTATTEISGVVYNSYSRTWAAGAISTQREHWKKTVTYAFNSASTITTSYALYVEAATAGTNATITNNYGFGTDGLVNIGNAAPAGGVLSQVRIGRGTGIIDIGEFAAGRGAIWFNQATPTVSNFHVAANATGTDGYLNGSSSSRLLVGGNIVLSTFQTQITFVPTAATASTVNFDFTSPNNTSRTASTNVSNFIVRGGTVTWNAGALTTQYFNYFTGNTVAFGSASTLSDGYNCYIESLTAGTNATITRKYSLGTSDNVAFGISNSTATFHLGVAPSGSNWMLSNAAGAGSTYLNAPTGGFIVLSVGTGNRMQVNNSSTAFTPSAAASGSTATFTFTNPNNTGRTVSTEVHGLKYTAGTQTWATSGTVATQRDWYLSGAIYATVGTTTITDAYGLYVDAATAGSGVTITNSWALGLNGNLSMIDTFGIAFGTGTGGKIGLATSQKIGFWNATPIVQPTTAVAAATFVANTSGIANDTATFDGYTIGQVVKALRNTGLLA